MDGGEPTSPVEVSEQADGETDAVIASKLAQVDEMIAQLKAQTPAVEPTEPTPAGTHTNGDDPAMLKLAALAQVETILEVARAKAADLASQPEDDPTTDPVEVASVMARLDEMQRGLEAEAARLLDSTKEVETPEHEPAHVEPVAPQPVHDEAPAERVHDKWKAPVAQAVAPAEIKAETEQPVEPVPAELKPGPEPQPAFKPEVPIEVAAPPEPKPTIEVPAQPPTLESTVEVAALTSVWAPPPAAPPQLAPPKPQPTKPADTGPVAAPILPFGGARYNRAEPTTQTPAETSTQAPAETPTQAPAETRPARAITPPAATPRIRPERTRRRRPVPLLLVLLIGLVTVCLAFVLVQTVGTTLLEHRSQHAAKVTFQKGVAIMRPGQPVGLMNASRASINDLAVIEGIRSSDLGRGPGHDPVSAVPGQDGVIVIAGHRTTYGGAFRHVDRFRPGDEITIKTATGLYRYLVVESNVLLGRTTGTLHAPDAKAIQQAGGIPQQGGRLLVLVTSSPRYRNQHRLVTVAVQTGETRTNPATPPPAPANAKPSLPTFRGEPGEAVIALLWLAAALVSTWIAFWLGRRRIPAVVAAVIGTPFVLALLYLACLSGGRMLPQTY